MRIVIAGASGHIGQMLVPILRSNGKELLLLGRSTDSLREKFSDCAVANYVGLSEVLKGTDILLNLAVVNSDAATNVNELRAVNVDFAVQLAKAAKDAGARFINVSSVHALDSGKTSAYAQSKRDGAIAVDTVGGDSVHVYLPSTYGERFAGALRYLNYLPKLIVPIVFGPISALKPTLCISRFADWLCNDIDFSQREVLLSDGQEKNLTYRSFTRAVDLFAAICGLIVFALPMLVIAILISRQCDGPVIFKQQRLGRGAKPYKCYKFRTMAVGTRQAATHEVASSLVTPVGVYLRRYKFDELPQLWNVLLGDMSLIGPRPCLPEQTELVHLRMAARVFDIRPGISGLAQISGIDMSNPSRLILWDVRYLALRGLLLDLRLIFRTLLGGGQGDNVVLTE